MDFISKGEKIDSIPVILDHRMIELFSDGLYSSSNKASFNITKASLNPLLFISIFIFFKMALHQILECTPLFLYRIQFD